MLDGLFGSKNIQRILIFLFVNGKCYGSQLQKLLQTALTPIQKALSRLENAGIIISYSEGKTKLYQFNSGYPLIEELELLLKKAYTILPPQEKRLYTFVKHENLAIGALEKNENTLLLFWKRLTTLKQLSFHAKSKSKEETGWNGKGKAEILLTKESDNVLIFQEKGTWKAKDGNEMDFSNCFRWTLDPIMGRISLEHLRRGMNHPVFLFQLAPSGKHTLSSVDTHLCGRDAYFGQAFCDRKCIRLTWRVIGPKKNEEIEYCYY
ncbi:MAG: winged helix-turn-helix transcriptional regulator [Chlamydiae bacterium]|jgi:hypothetical protein|nr:winged helix-turn-helix transcriptional regulator [Chlamydiota bacterium]